jgi:uncharacterized protein YegL
MSGRETFDAIGKARPDGPPGARQMSEYVRLTPGYGTVGSDILKPIDVRQDRLRWIGKLLSPRLQTYGTLMSDERVRERTSAEQGQLVMPFYLVCDVSFSMFHEMSALNEGIKRLRQAIVSEPVVEDVAQVCIISFSGSAKVVMPMGPMSESEIPELSAEDATNYGSAFHVLAQAIENDTERFKAHGYRVYRPCAFFLTDGLPTDLDWHKTFTSTLTYNRRTGIGMKAHPVFVPFGFRDAREDVLRQLAYPPDRGTWYYAQSVSIEEVLKGVLGIIMNTLISSGRSAWTGEPSIIQHAPGPRIRNCARVLRIRPRLCMRKTPRNAAIRCDRK